MTTSAPRFVFAGYFPKRVVPRPDWLGAPRVREIWSVSNCMTTEPEGWIDHWKHDTTTGLFDTIELAESVVPLAERASFQIVAYRVWDQMMDEARVEPLPVELKALPGPDEGFERIGFDAVERRFGSFGCSPLSCNHGASTFETNEYCLFKTADEAIDGAKAFSTGNWEPGPYWVVEVLRRPLAHGAGESASTPSRD